MSKKNYFNKIHERQLVGHVLVEALAVGRREDHLVVVALRLQRRDAAVDGLTLHDHAGASPVGIIVDATPFVERIVAQVVEVYLGQTFLLGPGQYRFVDEALEHLGQHGDDVYAHGWWVVG